MTLAPWPHFDADQIDAATRVLASGRVNAWTGQDTTAFDQEYAQWCGTAHAIAMANGSLALWLSRPPTWPSVWAPAMN